MNNSASLFRIKDSFDVNRSVYHFWADDVKSIILSSGFPENRFMNCTEALEYLKGEQDMYSVCYDIKNRDREVMEYN